MNFKSIVPDKRLSLFVKDILVFEETENPGATVLPFFADGYPGLMYQDTENGLVVKPHNKKMPVTFLYGQTIKPIELHIEGNYKLVVFQLYPFVLNSFFNITASDINDDCYDLHRVNGWPDFEKQLLKKSSIEKKVELISEFLLEQFIIKKEKLDFPIRQAIQLIIDRKTGITIKQLCKEIHLTERTFERRFLKEVGITARQFSQILKFQQSLEQITINDFNKLSDIVYRNGYADQSHFIRVFRAFTGNTPRSFLKKHS